MTWLMGIEGKQSRRMAPYELAQTSAPGNGRAVVLGGGLAGLLAARVLADWFEEVMIIERHNSPVARQVLPQCSRTRHEPSWISSSRAFHLSLSLTAPPTPYRRADQT